MKGARWSQRSRRPAPVGGEGAVYRAFADLRFFKQLKLGMGLVPAKFLGLPSIPR
jgi:hypothetical protein